MQHMHAGRSARKKRRPAETHTAAPAEQAQVQVQVQAQTRKGKRALLPMCMRMNPAPVQQKQQNPSSPVERRPAWLGFSPPFSLPGSHALALQYPTFTATANTPKVSRAASAGHTGLGERDTHSTLQSCFSSQPHGSVDHHARATDKTGKPGQEASFASDIL